MDRDNFLLIISILIAIVISVFTVIGGADPNILIIVLPLVSVLIVFLISIYLMGKVEKRLSQSLNRRLPEARYLESRSEVEIETTKLAEQADEYIVATGGRSRNQKYLKVIENKVRTGELTYWRLILNERITHEMCEHLCSVLSMPNVMTGQIDDRGYGNILVVDTGFIIALPVPGHGGLMGIKIPNRASASRIFKYLMMVFPDSERISSSQEVKAICEQCSDLTDQPVEA